MDDDTSGGRAMCNATKARGAISLILNKGDAI